jgi:uncharacterized protein YdhG (YjbR/CyaY superfamily)
MTYDHLWAEYARRLERERDEAREQVATMREAIREAHEALSYILGDSVSFLRTTAIEKSEAALTKLQPFLK